MKKKYFAIFFLGLFILTGCSKQIEMDYTINSDGAIYDYVLGTVENADSVKLKTSDGNIQEGTIDGKDFQVSIPILGEKQNATLIFENEDGQLTKEVTFPKKQSIDLYVDFADKMNTEIYRTNPDAKTVFPTYGENGIQDISTENGVTVSTNIYNGEITGLQMRTEGDANKELPTILVAFQNAYDANSDKIAEAYNNTLDTKEKTSFTSNGYTFLFEYNQNILFVDIFKK